MTQHSVRPGVRLAVDVGTVRVGIARSDPAGVLAVPVETTPRSQAHERLRELVVEYSPIEVIVGRPVGLSGDQTASTRDAESFAQQLANDLTCPVRMLDERLSTVEASAMARRSGHTAKSERAIIDQAAAVIILQHSLDSETRGGVVAGQIVEKTEGGQ